MSVYKFGSGLAFNLACLGVLFSGCVYGKDRHLALYGMILAAYCMASACYFWLRSRE